MNRTVTQIAFLALVAAIAYASGYHRGNRADSTSSSANFAQTPAEPALPEPSPSPSSPSPEERRPSVSDYPIVTMRAKSPAERRNEGYESARQDLEAALKQASSFPGPEQAFFVAGIFAFIAESSSPRDALAIASEQTNPVRGFALRSLVSEWAQESASFVPGDPRNQAQRFYNNSRSQFGLEAELAFILSRSGANSDVLDAWSDAFAKGPGRLEIMARLAAGQSDFDPDAPLAIDPNWTEWEKERFPQRLMDNWSLINPTAAWKWHSANGKAPPANFIEDWARRDTQELIQNLDTFEYAEDRLLAIESISAILATRSTAQALDWVERLADASERDAGFQAVYKATPQGIGAIMGMENGFPKIQKILPGGALEGTGIMAGDLIVESREADGVPNNLYGVSMHETVNHLRGAPGSSVEIRVLRENAATGELEEHSVTVERDLLILDPDAAWKDIDRP